MSTGEGVLASLGLTSLGSGEDVSQVRARPGVVHCFTFLYNVRTAFLLYMCFAGEPLDAFAKCVHVRILEYIDDHDDLVVSGRRVAHVVVKEGWFPYKRCAMA